MLMIERKFEVVNYPAQTRRRGRGRILNPIVLFYATPLQRRRN
jgi:hypothetical protein